MYSDSRHERYFKACPKCGVRLPNNKMILLKKANWYGSKNLTRLCKDCYKNLLEYLKIEDVEL